MIWHHKGISLTANPSIDSTERKYVNYHSLTETNLIAEKTGSSHFHYYYYFCCWYPTQSQILKHWRPTYDFANSKSQGESTQKPATQVTRLTNAFQIKRLQFGYEFPHYEVQRPNSVSILLHVISLNQAVLFWWRTLIKPVSKFSQSEHSVSNEGEPRFTYTLNLHVNIPAVTLLH